MHPHNITLVKRVRRLHILMPSLASSDTGVGSQAANAFANPVYGFLNLAYNVELKPHVKTKITDSDSSLESVRI